MAREDSVLAPMRQTFIGILALVVFAPLFTISFFDHPTTDDFCFAASMQDFGFVSTQIQSYMGWNGRYSSTAVMSLLTGYSTWINEYNFVPVALLLLTFASISLFTKVAPDIYTHRPIPELLST